MKTIEQWVNDHFDFNNEKGFKGDYKMREVIAKFLSLSPYNEVIHQCILRDFKSSSHGVLIQLKAVKKGDLFIEWEVDYIKENYIPFSKDKAYECLKYENRLTFKEGVDSHTFEHRFCLSFLLSKKDGIF